MTDTEVLKDRAEAARLEVIERARRAAIDLHRDEAQAWLDSFDARKKVKYPDATD